MLPDKMAIRNEIVAHSTNISESANFNLSVSSLPQNW